MKRAVSQHNPHAPAAKKLSVSPPAAISTVLRIIDDGGGGDDHHSPKWNHTFVQMDGSGTRQNGNLSLSVCLSLCCSSSSRAVGIYYTAIIEIKITIRAVVLCVFAASEDA